MKARMHTLEKSLHFWLLTSILTLFFLLRLPSLFEPYWYGDEGIYETIAYALNNGFTLYSQIWDNKPPLLYLTYAFFNGDQFQVRLLSLTTGILSIVALYFLANKLFADKKIALIATTFFAAIFAVPTFEGNIANAENFMLPLSILAGFFIYKNETYKTTKLFVPGLLLGISFLYKIVGVFDFAAFFIFLAISNSPEEATVRKIKTYLLHICKPLLVYCVGFFTPFVVSVFIFAFKGALNDYISAIFLSTVGYVGYNNVFLIPQGLLVSKSIILLSFLSILFIKRKRMKRSTLFILVWVAFSIFNSFFSQRPYTHYLLVLLPSISLLAGAIFYTKNTTRYLLLGLTLIITTTTLMYFRHWNIKKTIGYYQNFIEFVIGKKSTTAYQSFFDKNTTRDQSIVTYLQSKNISRNDLLVWGNSAQIYYLTKTLPPTKFTVAYHIQGNKTYEQDLEKQINKKPPKFIVTIGDIPSSIHTMYNYKHVLMIRNANIYEIIH